MGVVAPGIHDATGTEPAPYFPISPRKLVLLSLLSGGLYQLYWFYRNWRFVRQRDGSDLWPIARAIFAPFFYPALIKDIQGHAESRPSPVVPGGALAPSIAYFGLAMAASLPDPFWVVSLLSVLALLPAVGRINSFTSEASPDYVRNSSWRPATFLLAAGLGPLVVLVTASTMNLIPSTQVVHGWLVWPQDRAFLERSGVVSPGDRILFFYSQGIFSIRTDGNLLTDRAVTSYWEDEEGFFVETASFEEIAEVIPEFGDPLEDTVVSIVRTDGSEFVLVLSVEARRDQLFLRALQDRVVGPEEPPPAGSA